MANCQWTIIIIIIIIIIITIITYSLQHTSSSCRTEISTNHYGHVAQKYKPTTTAMSRRNIHSFSLAKSHAVTHINANLHIIDWFHSLVSLEVHVY